MKTALIEFLTLLLALMRTPTENEAEIEELETMINDHKALIDTAHGDSELNDPEITKLIDDLTEVAAAAEPDPEHAEVPEIEEADEEPAPAKGKSKKPAAKEEEEPAAEEEEEETTEEEVTEEEEEEPAETPREKRLREKAEADAKAKKKTKGK